jgi:tetratricopeptide (TPR) repeat protein
MPFLLFMAAVILAVPNHVAAREKSPARLSLVKTLDNPHPFCPAAVDLNVAPDYFVPIGNDLPGMTQYNALIHQYERKDWDELEAGIDRFKKLFEASPLLEAVYYLRAQALIDRLGSAGDDAVKQAERTLRETLLLYPKSELAPVVSSSMANYWLKRGDYARSLALYRANRQNYPFHALACVFQLGMAESEFREGQNSEAEPGFKQLLQKCQNETLRTATQIRLIDIDWQTAAGKSDEAGKKKAHAALASLYSHSFSMVEKNFPTVLHNLGEMEYQNRNYTKAKFYFTEFLKSAASKTPTGECRASAEKRLTDVAFRSGAPIPGIIGNYLTVGQEYPRTEAGTMANIQALLLDFDAQPRSEQDRRVKLLDEGVDLLRDENLRTSAFLQKGLALLDAGQEAALPYLMRLQGKTPVDLHRGPFADFIRDRLMKLLEARVAENAQSLGEDGFSDDLEKASEEWLKGTRYERHTRDLFAQLTVKKFEDEIDSNKLERGLGRLAKWKQSEMLGPKNLDRKLRRRITEGLLRGLFTSTDPKTTAMALLDQREIFTDLVDPSLPGFWIALAVKTGNDELLAKYVGPKSRVPSSIEYNVADDIRDNLAIAKGQAYRRVRRFGDAEAQLVKVKDPELIGAVASERLDILKETKQYNKAFDVGVMAMEHAPADKKKEFLARLSQVAFDGKLWSRVPSLLNRAVKMGITGKELATYRYLAGRASFERGDWKQSVQQYENALLLDPQAPENAEARYRLGKSLYRVRRKQAAIKVWQDLADQKDPFWSPLASNEIKTLD